MSVGKQGLTVTVTALVVISMVFSGVGLGASQDSTNPSAISDTDVFEVSDGGQIMAWERAAFPLRADNTGSATQVPKPTIYGEELDGDSFTSDDDGTNSKSLVRDFGNERNPFGVHQDGSDVSITFDESYANSGSTLDGQQRVEFVAARIKTNDGNGVPTTSSEALDLFSSVQTANDEASFEMILDSDDDNIKSLDSTGAKTVQSSFSEGHYVIMAAVHAKDENGLEVGEDGREADDISVDGDVTIIGVDMVTVQKDSATVTKPSDTRVGANLTFDVDTTNAFDSSKDGQITHAVALYKKSTFENARFDTVVDKSALGTGFTESEDMQLEHSIKDLNGVARVEDGTTLNQQSLSDGKISRPVSAASAIDFFADDVGANDPNTHAITNGGASNEEYETIDASVTAVNGESRSVSLNVDTLDDFSAGTYQYVVVSKVDNNDSQMSTTTGTITLSQPEAGISPSTEKLDFGAASATTDGSNTVTKSVTIESVGSSSLKLGTIEVVGADSDQFEITKSASGSIEPGDTRTIEVEFAPTERGKQTAGLSIQSTDADRSPLNISLTGTGEASQLSVQSTTPVELSANPDGTDSGTIRIKNTGNADLTTSASGLASPFSITSGSIPDLAPGETADITIEYAPSEIGTDSASLTLSTNNPFGSSRSVRVAGTATGPKVSLSVASGDTVTFGDVAVQQTATRSVVVSNDGTESLSINSISASGDFSVVSNVPDSLAPDASTVVDIEAKPTSAGTQTGTLSVDTSATQSAVTRDLSVTGKEAQISLSTANIDFEEVPAGASDVEPLTISNDATGSTATDLTVDVGSFSDSSPFSVQQSGESLTIEPGESETINVVYAPTSETSSSSSFDLSTNDYDDQTEPVGVSGTGVAPAFVVTDASPISFGPIAQSDTQTKTLTLENKGSATLTNFRVAGVGSDYSVQECQRR